MSTQRYVAIHGHNVYFPYEPYGVQKVLMDNVLKALTRGEHAILESPTGTGKTLALLCAALAWQEKEKLRIRELNMQKRASASEPTIEIEIETGPALSVTKKRKGTAIEQSIPNKKQRTDTPARVPRIFYGTRTHSQLKQLVQELRKTSYRPRIAVLGSRDHLCIHPTISKSPFKNYECRRLVESTRGCTFKNNKTALTSDNSPLVGGDLHLWDIEDIASLGREMKACPYFAAKTLSKEADIVFCPYNYLVDPEIRDHLGVDLADSVIIFDEAHNIEDSAIAAASFAVDIVSLEDTTAQLGAVVAASPLADIHQPLFQVFDSLIRWVRAAANDVVDTAKHTAALQGHNVLGLWKGPDAVTRLADLGITYATMPALAAAACAARALALDITVTNGNAKSTAADKPSSENTATAVSTAPTLSLKALAVVEGFVRTVRGVVEAAAAANSAKTTASDFSLVLVQQSVPSVSALATLSTGDNTIGHGGDSNNKHNVSNNHSATLWLHVLCHNPAVAITPLVDAARAIVLTSGTLAPLDSFASELGVRFSHKVETSAAIDTTRQLWAGVVTHATANAAMGMSTSSIRVVLDASYRNAASVELLDAIGNSIFQICQSVSGGILCFFPSYQWIDRAVGHWRSTGLWSRLCAVKLVVREPRGGGSGDSANSGAANTDDFATAMTQYYTAVRQATENLQGRQFTERGKGGRTGALFLAVFRGKVSEGIDFRDEYARAVIAVGVPYPNVKDLQISLKREYNDRKAAEVPEALNGSQWYTLQAFRAVNQALGRCIRHARDYGALVLLDVRYSEESASQKLSRWLRGSLRIFSDVSKAVESLDAFFKEARAAFGTPLPEPLACVAASTTCAASRNNQRRNVEANVAPNRAVAAARPASNGRAPLIYSRFRQPVMPSTANPRKK